MSALIEFQDVSKVYEMGDSVIRAADHISMRIEKGEFVAIVGQSGSGKSTCMNIIGCLDVPSSGTYLLDGQDVGKMDKNQLAEIRNKMLGFIFQQYNLLPKLTLLENVEVPMLAHCERLGMSRDYLFGGELVNEYAFTNELKMMGHIWRRDDKLVIAAKGSAEQILTICDLTGEERATAERKIMEMSTQGLRVIAVATATPAGESEIPPQITDCRLRLCGLVGLADPPRESVKADIAMPRSR